MLRGESMRVALYAVLYMPSQRTQVYLTAEQRQAIDARMKRDGKSLAWIVREALNEYLTPPMEEVEAALAETFGAIPDLKVAGNEMDRHPPGFLEDIFPSLQAQTVNAIALVDTDVLIDHLRGHRRLKGARLGYSVITRSELFAGADVPDVIRRLLGALEEVGLDRATAETAGVLKRTHGLPLADAVIAATARELNLPLVTRNARHFGRVEDLRLQAPA